jgi:hypothetical protein
VTAPHVARNTLARVALPKSGDLIDLFHGSRVTERAPWIRIHWGISWDGVWSDFKKSKEIWFWQME